MDNVSFHKSTVVREALQQKHYIPLFTPPYCPNANPIENLFGVIKNNVRKTWESHDFDETIDEAVVQSVTQLKCFSKIFNHAVEWTISSSAGISYDDVYQLRKWATQTYT